MLLRSTARSSTVNNSATSGQKRSGVRTGSSTPMTPTPPITAKSTTTATKSTTTTTTTKTTTTKRTTTTTTSTTPPTVSTTVKPSNVQSNNNNNNNDHVIISNNNHNNHNNNPDDDNDDSLVEFADYDYDNITTLSGRYGGANVFAYTSDANITDWYREFLQRSNGDMYFKAEMQRYDGWYNNLAHPAWGSTGNCYCFNLF